MLSVVKSVLEKFEAGGRVSVRGAREFPIIDVVKSRGEELVGDYPRGDGRVGSVVGSRTNGSNGETEWNMRIEACFKFEGEHFRSEGAC